jgi:hypothetical protein
VLAGLVALAAATVLVLFRIPGGLGILTIELETIVASESGLFRSCLKILRGR